MKILPPVSFLWPHLVDRKHAPPSALGVRGYLNYRACLRWEFAFSCAFCTCHEADLSQLGTKRSGLTEVEHFITQKEDSGQRNVYANCFHSCRYCNRARRAMERVNPTGNRLLNPCTSVWNLAFELFADRMHPRGSNADAEYTHEAYKLDEPIKVRMRRMRRETISELIPLVNGREMWRIQRELIEKGRRLGLPEFVEAARILGLSCKRARQDIKMFSAIPDDCETCRCEDDGNSTLPASFEQSLVAIQL